MPTTSLVVHHHQPLPPPHLASHNVLQELWLRLFREEKTTGLIKSLWELEAYFGTLPYQHRSGNRRCVPIAQAHAMDEGYSSLPPRGSAIAIHLTKRSQQ